MALFKVKGKSLEQIYEEPFRLERDLQFLVENNMDFIFELLFVRHEFTLANLRIDTLAYDKDSKSFAIIEYKKDRNFSVIDQGMSYLGLLLNNKADIILEYNEKFNASLRRDDIDWSQTRVIFVSPSFTTFQLESINFKDLPIELWEVKRYSNDTIRFDRHEAASNSSSLKTVSKKSEAVRTITKEVKVYSEEEHLKIAKPEVKELYFRFKEMVLAINDTLTVKPMKQYIAFKSKTNISDVVVRKNKLSVYLNIRKGQLNDPLKIVRDITQVGHWGNGDYRFVLDSEEKLEYAVSLVRQSYEINN